ncbi:MAG TPA: tetratricopeptide repeat protein [Thermodesulfobacteriota bacterium]|nr:tetratricopeptide repeat protein [Thermodesulfobacteriota bacterium]
MKKESVIVFVALAFVVGVVVGVVATVMYEDRTLPASVKAPMAGSPAPSASINPEMQKQISALQSILKDDPKNFKALVELGNLYFDGDQIDPAIRYYSRALEIEPKNADVRTDMGIMYRKKGDFDRAITEFKKAAEDDPRHVNSRYNLGIVLLHDKGDMKGAIKAWEDYLKVEPDGPRAQNIRNQMEKMRAMAK